MRGSERRQVQNRISDIVRGVRWRWRARLLLRGLMWVVALTATVTFLAALALERARFDAGTVVALRTLTWITLVASTLWFLVRPLLRRVTDAQVAMYQDGEVDYMIATDAIGMGLNMDIDHVAFAQTRKFDGRIHRRLDPSELAQIAGRAGRHMNDGTFGTTTEIGGFDEETVAAIEGHKFEPLRRAFWRNWKLDFKSIQTLRGSLSQLPELPGLVRAREAEAALSSQTPVLWGTLSAVIPGLRAPTMRSSMAGRPDQNLMPPPACSRLASRLWVEFMSLSRPSTFSSAFRMFLMSRRVFCRPRRDLFIF